MFVKRIKDPVAALCILKLEKIHSVQGFFSPRRKRLVKLKLLVYTNSMSVYEGCFLNYSFYCTNIQIIDELSQTLTETHRRPHIENTYSAAHSQSVVSNHTRSDLHSLAKAFWNAVAQWS